MNKTRRIFVMSWLLYFALGVAGSGVAAAATALGAPAGALLAIGMVFGIAMGIVLGRMPTQRDLKQDEAA